MKSSVKYLIYNEIGEVKMISSKVPNEDLMQHWAGFCAYNGEVSKPKHRSNIAVDPETLEVTVEFEEIIDEANEIKILKEQINVLSDTLDFILVQGGVE